MKSFHMAVLGIVLAALAGLGMVRVLRSTASEDVDPAVPSNRPSQTGAIPTKIKRDRGGALPQMDPHASLIALIQQPEGDLRDRALEDFLQDASTDDPEVLAEELLASADRIDVQRALATVIAGWMNRSPQACLAWLEESGLEMEQQEFLIQTAYAVWARLDPPAALDSVMSGARPPMILNAAFAAAADVDFQAAYSAYLQAGAGIKSEVIESLTLVAAAEGEAETASLVQGFIQFHPNVSDQIRFGRNLAVIDRSLADSIISTAGQDQMRQELLTGIFGSNQAVHAFGTKERDAGPAGDEEGLSDGMDASQEDARAIGNEASR